MVTDTLREKDQNSILRVSISVFHLFCGLCDYDLGLPIGLVFYWLHYQIFVSNTELAFL